MTDKAIFQLAADCAIRAHVEFCTQLDNPYEWPMTAESEFGMLKVEHLKIALALVGGLRDRFISGYKEWQLGCPRCPWLKLENGVERNTQEMLREAGISDF